MTKLEFKFKSESENKLAKFSKLDSLDIDIWCSIDIQIDDKSFYKNFSNDFYSENGFNKYSTSNSGFGAPLFPFFHSIIEAPEKLKEKGQVIIEDSMGQTAIEIFATFIETETVAIAVRIWEDGSMYHWYDGHQVYLQEEIPISKNNVIKFDDFKKGCLTSVKDKLEPLINKYPYLKKDPYCNSLLTKVNKLSL